MALLCSSSQFSNQTFSQTTTDLSSAPLLARALHLERKEPESNQTLSVRDNTMSDPNNNRNNNSSKYTRYPPKFPITSSTTSKEIEEYKVEFRNQQTYCNGAYTGVKRLLLDMHGAAGFLTNSFNDLLITY